MFTDSLEITVGFHGKEAVLSLSNSRVKVSFMMTADELKIIGDHINEEYEDRKNDKAPG